MKDVQCYEVFGGIALKNHAFSFFFHFHFSLQMTVNDVPRNEVLLLLGDLRTRVECNNKNKEIDVGQHRMDDLTNSGERVINYSEENDLIIGEALYTHRSTHKLN